MNSDPTRIEALFDAALERTDATERDAFLREECAQDGALLAQVRRLLEAHSGAGTFLETQVSPGNAADIAGETVAAPRETIGTFIGRYKLLQEIGEGGFGIVYMAEQTEPVKRRVALKVVKPGMDTREVIARFEAERQALALMDHPNIAQVYDGGATDNGRPYFVMELVKGVPVTKYCDQQQLNTRQRLDLFLDVLSAVQHAHQKGIIHRDLKPTNILVSPHDGRPVIKVIDFGIAKALSMELTARTLFTGYGQMIGTPQYMSPEQAEMNALDVDTRSDIYAMGVLLYELLTGRTPLDPTLLRGAAYAEIQRLIREEEPPRPSTRVSTLKNELPDIARQRSTEPLKLGKQISGDLDWIVMKALEKERDRRYETASAFAADIRRHLANEPVSAVAPSAAYRFRKFARRNKTAFRVTAVVAAVMIAATGISVWQAVRARQAEALATERLEDLEAISSWLIAIFRSPEVSADGSKATMADTLKRAAETLETDFKGRPGRQAPLQFVLGSAWRNLGMAKEAIPLQEKALQYFEQTLGPENPDTMAAIHNLASSYDDDGRKADALKLREKLLPLCRKVNGSEDPGTLAAIQNLANSLFSAGRGDEALKLREEALALSSKINGPQHRQTLAAMSNLAVSMGAAGNIAGAIKFQEQAFNAMRGALSPRDSYFRAAGKNLVSIYEKAGRKPEALKLVQEFMIRPPDRSPPPYTAASAGAVVRTSPPPDLPGPPTPLIVRNSSPPEPAPPQVAVAPRWPEVKPGAEANVMPKSEPPSPAPAAGAGTVELQSLGAPDASGSWLFHRRRR